MRRFLLLFMLILGCFTVQAQKHSITGSLIDTVNHKRPTQATITLIRASDSILSTFTHTDAEGNFLLHSDSAGTFILLITSPSYADLSDVIIVKNKHTSVGTILLTTRLQLLEEVVLHKRRSAITIKGDTTEFAADSFKVADGATVDALLKKLPGMEVDRNGSITAQGKKVEKVLVDGEEFFSDDPGLVTQSLQAKSVDVVQVYDRKSDAAIATGIDDGQKQKTINLKLKANMKKGFFGKAVAAAGTDHYCEEQAMVNAFKDKRQISLFGIVSNNGKASLGWGEYKFGSSIPVILEDGSGGSTNTDNASSTGQYLGDGIPSVQTGGVHYANKWHEGHEHLVGNYRFSGQNVDATNNTFTQYILPDSQYFSSQRMQSSRNNVRHGVDGMLELKVDSFSSIEAKVNGGLSHNISNSIAYAETRGSYGSLINNSNRSISTDIINQNIASSVSYRRTFAKANRLLYLQLQENYKTSSGTEYLFSDNHFYTATSFSDSINQQKTTYTQGLSLYSNISYTEPLSKQLKLNIAYRISNSTSNSQRLSFNKSGTEWSDQADTLYSSSYKYNVTTHNASTTLHLKGKKYYVAIGADLYYTKFNQPDLLHDTDISRAYNNFSPTGSVRFDISKSSSLSVDYSGRTQQPTLSQLQPLHQNADPLNVAIGNPRAQAVIYSQRQLLLY